MRDAQRLTVVDASSEALAINTERLGGSSKVDYVQADLFRWQPTTQYDFIFFAFWLSHVPRTRVDAFWALLRSALKPGAKVFFIDSLHTDESTARDHEAPSLSGVVQRQLDDGRSFEIVKIFYEAETLERALREDGWEGYVRSSGQFFVYGELQASR